MLLIIRHEPCRLASSSHVPRIINRSHSELTLIASDPAHAIDRQQLFQARFVPRRRRPRRFEENASTSLDLRSCQTASELQVMPALFQQFCASLSGFVLSACNWEKAKHMGLQMSKCGFSTLNLLPRAPYPILSADPSPRLHSSQTHQLVAGTLLASTLPPVQQHQLK